MSSASEIEQRIRAYLSEQGGSALAGDVTAHLVEAGFASSSVRRVADRVVVKERAGNVFRWRVPAARPRQVVSPPPDLPFVAGRLVSTARAPLGAVPTAVEEPVDVTPAPALAPDPVRPTPDPVRAFDPDDLTTWDATRLRAACARRGIDCSGPAWDGATEPEMVLLIETHDSGDPEPALRRAPVAPLPY